MQHSLKGCLLISQSMLYLIGISVYTARIKLVLHREWKQMCLIRVEYACWGEIHDLQGIIKGHITDAGCISCVTNSGGIN